MKARLKIEYWGNTYRTPISGELTEDEIENLKAYAVKMVNGNISDISFNQDGNEVAIGKNALMSSVITVEIE